MPARHHDDRRGVDVLDEREVRRSPFRPEQIWTADVGATVGECLNNATGTALAVSQSIRAMQVVLKFESPNNTSKQPAARVICLHRSPLWAPRSWTRAPGLRAPKAREAGDTGPRTWGPQWTHMRCGIDHQCLYLDASFATTQILSTFLKRLNNV